MPLLLGCTRWFLKLRRSPHSAVFAASLRSNQPQQWQRDFRALQTRKNPTAYQRRLKRGGSTDFSNPFLLRTNFIQGETHAIRDDWKPPGLRGAHRPGCRTNPARCTADNANVGGFGQVAGGRGYADALQGSECHDSPGGQQQGFLDRLHPLPTLRVDRRFDRWRGQDPKHGRGLVYREWQHSNAEGG